MREPKPRQYQSDQHPLLYRPFGEPRLLISKLNAEAVQEFRREVECYLWQDRPKDNSPPPGLSSL